MNHRHPTEDPAFIGEVAFDLFGTITNTFSVPLRKLCSAQLLVEVCLLSDSFAKVCSGLPTISTVILAILDIEVVDALTCVAALFRLLSKFEGFLKVLDGDLGKQVATQRKYSLRPPQSTNVPNSHKKQL